MTIDQFVKNKIGKSGKGILTTIQLLAQGATIPFLSRYRKEQTGNLDEVEIQAVRDAMLQFEEIQKRKAYILGVLKEKGVTNQKLVDQLNESYDLTVLEDLYLPYKSKRKTKAEQARTAGLEGLAKLIMKQDNGDPIRLAERFTTTNYPLAEDAIQGALYIIADWMNENIVVREKLRTSFREHGAIHSKVIATKKDEAQKFKDYFEYKQRLLNCPSYRLLAILRGEAEGYLRVKIEPNREYAESWLQRFFVKNTNANSELVIKALKDAYKRLLQPSLATETKNHYKTLADEQSIKTFAKNLENLLLAPPIGAKRILAIDPGFKSGCKVVCLDEQGSLLNNCTIFPHPPKKDHAKAAAKISQLVQAYKIGVIAVGDGTAGRETEQFVKRIRFDRDLTVYVVREDGASIYSASKIAREEFPTYDVTVRGAVSIGRRLMDPLAELVKIDPKSLGVGQYQHDVNQVKLQQQLDQVVLNTVNKVGVNLNTASKYLLSYVAGIGPKLADNIVQYRTQHGSFKSRQQLKKVDRLGANAFEQCAGFLRIREGENPLDNSAVHPENYDFLTAEIKKMGMKVEAVIGNAAHVKKLKQNIQSTALDKVGKYTLDDIFKELEKPGVDPRKKAKVLQFSESIQTIDDLKVGMKLTGIVTNVTDFGAFVNIGIKENGLIHKTQLSDQHIAHPTAVVQLHEHLSVTVITVDTERKRIGLSLRN